VTDRSGGLSQLQASTIARLDAELAHYKDIVARSVQECRKMLDEGMDPVEFWVKATKAAQQSVAAMDSDAIAFFYATLLLQAAQDVKTDD
jgi:hypothetical protein